MPEPSPSWSPAQRWGFRWAALYFALYSAIPLSLEVLPISEMLQSVLLWIARNVLGLEGPFTTVDTGSGDTALEYVNVLLYLVLASVGCIVWSSLDRRAAHP